MKKHLKPLKGEHEFGLRLGVITAAPIEDLQQDINLRVKSIVTLT